MTTVRVAMAGLSLELELLGGAGPMLAEGLGPYLEPSVEAAQPGAPTLKLRLAADDGFPDLFDPLVVRGRLGAFEVRGDGMHGQIARDQAELSAKGGAFALWAALRLACALWLLPRGGLLLHGACVEERGAAHAFLGPSGAGKTTLAGKLRARVISDEVTCANSALRVFGHPFRSKLGDGCAPREGLPLASLSILSHALPGEGPRARQLSKAEAVRALLARIFLPVRDAQTLAAALEIAGALADPGVRALSLPLDSRAAAFALEASPQ